MSRGRRVDDAPKLNKKKVLATIIAILVVIMVVLSFKTLLSPGNGTKDVSSLTTYFSAYTNGKWGVIDNKGNIVIEPTMDEMIVIPNENEDVFICTSSLDFDTESFVTKVLNSENEEILTNYNNVQAFENTDGSAVWYETAVLKFEENGKSGLIDFSGKVILDANYDSIEVLSGIKNSLVLEENGNKGIFSTSSLEIIVPTEYSNISALTDSYENGYIVENDSGKKGVISINKKTVVEVKYDDIKNVYGNGVFVVTENGSLEVIDSSRKYFT